MTKYSDFEIKKKKYTDENNTKEAAFTNYICDSIMMSINYCDPTNASGCTGCCNSQKNCPGSTGRRK